MTHQTVFQPHWEREREDFFRHLDYTAFPTPAYVIHLTPLEENLRILASVRKKTGCKILLALKGFAAWKTFPLIRQYLDGVCASSVYEARLGHEEFRKEVHSYAPAYSPKDIQEHLLYSDHLIFNSFNQWGRYKDILAEKMPCGMRINPESQNSGSSCELYNPCGRGSRLGVTAEECAKNEALLDGITMLHFHTLCEQGVEALETTLTDVEGRFGRYLSSVEVVNFGGGHHITRSDYDVDRLCHIIDAFQQKYSVQVILEPGEAVALNAGVLVATVLDIVENNGLIAILDTTAEAHIPDLLSMPYRPSVIGGDTPGKKPYTYRLGGLTCLAGDFFGSYSFDKKLSHGDKVIFQNMAIYTMVKNTLFNGVRLPDIFIMDSHDKVVHSKHFEYCGYKERLS